MKRLLSMLLAVAVVASCVFVLPVTATTSDLFTYTEGGQWSADYADNAAILDQSTDIYNYVRDKNAKGTSKQGTYAYADGKASLDITGDVSNSLVHLTDLDLSKLNLNTDSEGWVEVTMDVNCLPYTKTEGYTYFDGSCTYDDTTQTYSYTTGDNSYWVFGIYPLVDGEIPYGKKVNSTDEDSVYNKYYGLITVNKRTDEKITVTNSETGKEEKKWDDSKLRTTEMQTAFPFQDQNDTGAKGFLEKFDESKTYTIKMRVEKNEDGTLTYREYIKDGDDWIEGYAPRNGKTFSAGTNGVTSLGLMLSTSGRATTNFAKYTLSNAKVTQSVPATVRLSDLSGKTYGDSDTVAFDFVIPADAETAKLTVDGTEVENFSKNGGVTAGAYTGSLNLAALGKTGRVTMTLSGTANGESFSKSTDFYISAPAAGSLNEAVFTDLKQGGFYADSVTFKNMEEGVSTTGTNITFDMTPGAVAGSTAKFTQLGDKWGGSTGGVANIFDWDRTDATKQDDATGYSAKLTSKFYYIKTDTPTNNSNVNLMNAYRFGGNTPKVLTGQISADKVLNINATTTNASDATKNITRETELMVEINPIVGRNATWSDVCGIKFKNGKAYVYAGQTKELGDYTANRKIDFKYEYTYDLKADDPDIAVMTYCHVWAKFADSEDWIDAGTVNKDKFNDAERCRDDGIVAAVPYWQFRLKTYLTASDVYEGTENVIGMDALPTVTVDNVNLTETTPTDARIRDLSKGFYTSWDSVPVAFTLPEGYSDAILTVDGAPIAALDAASNPSGAYTGDLNLSALGKVGTIAVELTGNANGEPFTASTTMTVNPASASTKVVRETKDMTFNVPTNASNPEAAATIGKVSVDEETGWVTIYPNGQNNQYFNDEQVWADYNTTTGEGGMLHTYCLELGATVECEKAMPKFAVQSAHKWESRANGRQGEMVGLTNDDATKSHVLQMADGSRVAFPTTETDLTMRIFIERTYTNDSDHTDVAKVYWYIDGVCCGYQTYDQTNSFADTTGYMKMMFICPGNSTTGTLPFPIKVKTLTYDKFSVLQDPTVTVGEDAKTVTVSTSNAISADSAEKITLQTNDGTEIALASKTVNTDGTVVLTATETLPADVKVVFADGVKEADKSMPVWKGKTHTSGSTSYTQTNVGPATRKGETLSGAMSINVDNTVTDLAVTDLQVYQSGQSAIVKTTVNANGAATVGKLLIVGYKGTDTPSMTECKIVDATASEAGLEDNIYTVQLDKSFDYVRVFFWSDLGTMTPLYTTQSTL